MGKGLLCDGFQDGALHSLGDFLTHAVCFLKSWDMSVIGCWCYFTYLQGRSLTVSSLQYDHCVIVGLPCRTVVHILVIIIVKSALHI